MKPLQQDKWRRQLGRTLRLALEYSVTIGAAILCGYWIVQAR